MIGQLAMPVDAAAADPGAEWASRRLADPNLPSPDYFVEEKEADLLRPADHYMLVQRSTVILVSPVH